MNQSERDGSVRVAIIKMSFLISCKFHIAFCLELTRKQKMPTKKNQQIEKPTCDLSFFINVWVMFM